MSSCAQIVTFVKDISVLSQLNNSSTRRTVRLFRNNPFCRSAEDCMSCDKVFSPHTAKNNIFSKFRMATTVLVVAILVLSASQAQATTYYTFANSAPETLANWWTFNNGTGTHPGNFTTAGDLFVIQNNNTMTNAANWTVTGTVQITNGSTLTFTAGGTTLIIGGLTIDGGGIVNISRPMTVNGATSITGTINLQTTARTHAFNGDVTLITGANWNETINNTPTFSGNFTNGATTFTASTGVYTFSGNTKTFSGTTTTIIPSVAITGSYTNNGTLSVTTALSGAGSLTNGSSGTLNLSGAGAGSCAITTLANAGTINRSAAGTTTTALANFTNTGTINVSGSGAITGITNNAAGIVNLTGTSPFTSFNNAAANSTLNISSAAVPVFTALTATVAGNTVNYNAAGAQTGCVVTTYNNLTLSGSGNKTFATTPTINGTLSMEGTTAALIVTTGVATYGPNATLQYNKTAGYIATVEEWISPFVATGGIVIKNSGAITTPGLVQIGNNTNVPLFLNGGTLTPGANSITLHGDFTNTGGTLTSGSGGIIIAGTTATQTIAGFTTTGNVSCTKTGGTATITGAVSAANLSVSGALGTLVLNGANTFSGTRTISAGTLALGNVAALGAAGTSLVLNGGTLDLMTDATVNAYNVTVGASAAISTDRATSGTGITHQLGTLNITGAFTLSTTYGTNVTSPTIAGLSFGNTTITTSTTVFDVAQYANLTLGAITGNVSLTKQNSGQLTLNSASARSAGTTTLTAGILALGNSAALGTTATALVLNGGTLDLNSATSTNAYNTTIGGNTTITPDVSVTGPGITHTLGTLAVTGAFNLTVTGGTSSTSGTTGLSFGATTLTGAPTFTITNGSGTSVALLTLAAVTNGANTATINGNGSMAQSGVWGNGAGGIIYAGSGTGSLTLNQANTFTGGVTLNSGTLNINNTNALGTVAGTFVIAGGTINNSSAGAIATLNYPMSWNGDFAFTGTQNLNLGAGTITPSVSRQVTVNGGVLTVGGTLNAAAITLTKAGTGALNFGSQSVTLNGLVVNGGTLLSTSGTLSLAGPFTNSGTFTHNSGTVTLNGASAQIINGTSATAFNNLTLNNAAGVTLSAPISLSSAGVLTLTAGKITTDATNILTLNNTATGAISGGSTTNFIAGPMVWTLPASLASGTTYNFPVGKGSTYLPFGLNPTTGTGTVTAKVEAFLADCGGTLDGTLDSRSTTEYWTMTTAGNFTAGSVSLTRQTAITPLDVVAGSPTIAGAYTSLVGTTGANGVTASNPIGSNTAFVIAGKLHTFTTGTISGSPFCSGTAVSVPYTVAGTFVSGNIFTAQLSDATGSFASPTTLGTTTSTVSGTIVTTMPVAPTNGTAYRIRVISSNPVLTSSDNGVDLILNLSPIIPTTTAVSPTSVNFGTTGTITLNSGGGGGAGSTLYWYSGSCGGTPVGSGSPLTIATPAATTTYYARWENGTCYSACLSTTLTVIPPPLMYRSNGSGPWTTAGTWQTSADLGATWITSVGTPTSADGTVTIRTGNTVTLAGPITVDEVTIDSGGQLTITGGTVTIGNVAANGITVNGTLSNAGTLTKTGTLYVNSGATYIHAMDAGTIPAANTWDPASTLQVTGVVANYPAGLNQTFGNLTWNCTGQTSVAAYGTFSIAGTLTVQSTGGTGQFNFTNGNTNTILGNLVVSGGTVRLANGGASALNVSGSTTINGGTLVLSYGTATGTLTSYGDFTISSGTVSRTSTGVGAIIFAKTGTQTYLKSGGAFSGAINFTVNSGSILDVGTSLIDVSTGTFTLSGGAGIVTKHAQGLSTTAATGSIQVTGTKTYSGTANYTYNGSSAQATGNGLITANNLTINNTAGVTLTSATTVNGVLTFTNGILTPVAPATQTLTVGSNSTLAVMGGSATSFFAGALIWQLNTYGFYNFPVGKGSTYLPFYVSGVTATPQIRVEAFLANTGGTATSPLYSLSTSEYWLVTVPSGNGTFTAGSVTLSRPSSLGTLNAIARSTTLAGAYSNLNGTLGATSISSSDNTGAIPAAGNYFAFANKTNITIGTLAQTSFCPGASFSIPYTITGTFTAGNVFTAQLSSSTGTWGSPVTIGTLTSQTSGTISATIASGQTPGTGYRIRIVASTPAFTGSDNGSNLIVGSPTATAFNGSLCGPGGITLSVQATSGTVNWYSAATAGTFLASGSSYLTPNLTVTTTFYAEVVDGTCVSGSRIPVVANIVTPPSIIAGGGGTYCNGSTINLTSTLTNVSDYYWSGPNGFYSLLQNPVLTTNGTSALNGVYTVTGSALSGINLVTNGDFESGNTGFSSSYTYDGADLYIEGKYSVVANPQSVHPGFSACVDHTSGAGKQMVVNGAGVAGENIWSQTVNVAPNTDYQFTYYVQSVVSASPSQLQLYVNGTSAGPTYTASGSTCVWTQYTYNWNSGVSTTAFLSLVNENIILGGNDFALDDIKFQQICSTTQASPPVPDPNGPGTEYANYGIIRVTVSDPVTAGTIGTSQTVCSGSSVALTSGSPGSGSGTITYEWQTNASGSFVTIPAATSATYTTPTLAVTTSYQRRTVSTQNGTICYSSYTTPVVITINTSTVTPGGPDFTCQSATPSAMALTGASYAGGGSTGAAWSFVTGAGTLSNTGYTTTPATVTYTPPANYSGTVVVRLTTRGGTCAATADRAINVDQSGPWTGATDVNWNNAANWTCNSVPLITTVANINTGKPRYPTLSTGAVGTCKDLNIQASSSVTISGNTLQIAGAISNSGTFTATAGTVEMKGSSAQSIAANTFATNTIQNLIANNSAGVTLSGTLNVTGFVKATTGNLASNGFLKLISNATQTALIDGSGAGNVTGNVIMQRYLADAYGYKYFSPPFSSLTVNAFSAYVNLGATFPAFYVYNENQSISGLGTNFTTGWVKYVTPSSALSPMVGYCANFGSSHSASTVTLTGTVNNGSYSASLSNNNRTYSLGFNFVGNPYPSPIDWNAASGWTKSNIDNGLYFFDATGAADQYSGNYTSYVAGVSSGGSTNIIPSMQGFFVHVANGSFPVTGSLGMTNSVRTVDFTQGFKAGVIDPRTILRFTASLDGMNGKPDAFVIYFDPLASLLFEGDKDALKLMNTDINMPNLYAISPDVQKLSIDGMPAPDSKTTIPLGIQIYQDGYVNFSASDISKLSSNQHIYLTDSETLTLQDLKKTALYRVYLKAGEYTQRFALVFSPVEISQAANSGVKLFTLSQSADVILVNMNLPVDGQGDLRVTNMQGQTIYQKAVTGFETVQINSNLSSGVYLVTVISGKNSDSEKILIRKAHE